MDLLATQLQEIQEQYEAGLVREDALLGARLAQTDAELRIKGLELDGEEIRVTGRAPNNRLSAPEIGGRDFVSERLQLELIRADEEANLARAQLKRILDLQEAGMVG